MIPPTNYLLPVLQQVRADFSLHTSDANGNATWETPTGGSGSPLPFIADGDERMRIDANGNVGINTTDFTDFGIIFRGFDL